MHAHFYAQCSGLQFADDCALRVVNERRWHSPMATAIKRTSVMKTGPDTASSDFAAFFARLPNRLLRDGWLLAKLASGVGMGARTRLIFLPQDCYVISVVFGKHRADDYLSITCQTLRV